LRLVDQSVNGVHAGNSNEQTAEKGEHAGKSNAQVEIVDQENRKGNEGKNRKSKQPLVETEVRRSPRLKARNKGFKPNTCFSKKCLACLATPPDLSIELIKDIGVNLCQVDEHLLTDISLSKKRIS